MIRPGKLDAGATHYMHGALEDHGFTKENNFWGIVNLGWSRDEHDKEYIWGTVSHFGNTAFVIHMPTTPRETDWALVALQIQALLP
jgi:hypothetical protein